MVGFSEDLGKSNVVSSVAQLFLSDILNLILSQSHEMVVLVSEILEIIVIQGLGHPLSVCYFILTTKCIPYIVALETHPEVSIRSKAIALHRELVQKHASFIHSKNMECIKMMYKFQIMSQANSGEYLKGKQNHVDPYSTCFIFWAH